MLLNEDKKLHDEIFNFTEDIKKRKFIYSGFASEW